METGSSRGTCTQARIVRNQLHGGRKKLFFFLFFKKLPLTMPCHRPPESVCRSSPLVSHLLVAPPGLHGFGFRGRQGWSGEPPKKVKTKPFLVCRHLLGIWRGVVAFVFQCPGRRGKHAWANETQSVLKTGHAGWQQYLSHV